MFSPLKMLADLSLPRLLLILISMLMPQRHGASVLLLGHIGGLSTLLMAGKWQAETLAGLNQLLLKLLSCGHLLLASPTLN